MPADVIALVHLFWYILMYSRVTSIRSFKVLGIAAFRLVTEAQKISLVRSPLYGLLYGLFIGNMSQARKG